MADPQEIESILTTKVATPRSSKDKQEFSSFLRRLSNRPEIAGKTNAEIADGILLYLQDKEYIKANQVTTVPAPSDYDKAIKAIQAAKAKEATQQRKETVKAESSARSLFADEEKDAWQAIQDAIAQAKEQDKKKQAQRQEISKQHADAGADLDREHATMLAEARRAFDTEKENIEKAATLKKQEQARQEELRLRTAQLEARTAQRSLPPEKEQAKLLTEAEKEAQQRQLQDQQEQKKQTQALIERLVAREKAKKGQEAANAKRTELDDKYKEILSVPDAQVQATTDEVQKARELEAAQRIEQERLVAATQQEKAKQQQQHEERLQAKKAAMTARKEAKAQQEAAPKTAEVERKQKEEATDKAKSPAPLLIKWHEPGPRDLLRPDPTIARLEAQKEAALKAAAEAAKKKETKPAKTTDDLLVKPKSKAPELGSARDSREMAALHHADAVFAAAQQDHAARQEARDKEMREEAARKLEHTLTASLRTEIKAAKNTSWLSRTGEFHVERDRLATIMAGKVAKQIHDNPEIPTTYISGHAEEIARTTVDTMKTKTMAGTADPDVHESQDKTYTQLSEEFLEHRKNVADINEVLTGQRASGRSFDDKLAEATSTVVAEKAKQTLQQHHSKDTGRAH